MFFLQHSPMSAETRGAVMEKKLGLVALESAYGMGKKVNKVLHEWRGEDFLIPCECPRFSSGEAKGILGETVRDKDIYIMVDVCNNSLTYKMDGSPNRMSPDEGATERVVFLASLYGVNIGMFYKRRDYTRIVDGSNPIIAHDFCGSRVEGLDVIVIDDMIASGGSMIDVCRQLKDRGANRIFIFSTFGLFLNGLEKFDKAYAAGEFTRIFTTNLIYQKPELLEKEYYYSVNMGRYIAAIIDTLNKGNSLTGISKPALKIKSTIEKYNSRT